MHFKSSSRALLKSQWPHVILEMMFWTVPTLGMTLFLHSCIDSFIAGKSSEMIYGQFGSGQGFYYHFCFFIVLFEFYSFNLKLNVFLLSFIQLFILINFLLWDGLQNCSAAPCFF